MRLPNKLYRYNDTILRDMIVLLTEIKQPIEILDLYKKTNKVLQSMDRFIEALDCLFFLNRITFDKRTEKIDVIRNQM